MKYVNPKAKPASQQPADGTTVTQSVYTNLFENFPGVFSGKAEVGGQDYYADLYLDEIRESTNGAKYVKLRLRPAK